MAVASRSLIAITLVALSFQGEGMAQDCCPETPARIKIHNHYKCGKCKKDKRQCRCGSVRMQRPQRIMMPQPCMEPQCNTQQLIPMPQITIPQAALVPQITMQPVYETQYCPKQVVTNRQVTETQYHQQAYTETVPVQTVENVTVDEGHWQQVWVAKPVTKQVARTTYQQRTAYRTVPQQVTRVVPEVSTTMVPVQSIRYVAQTSCVAANGAPTGNCDTASLTPFTPTVSSFYNQSTTSPYAYQSIAPITTALGPTPAYDGGAVSRPVPDARHMELPNAPTYEPSNLDHNYTPPTTTPQPIPRRGSTPMSYADDLAPRVSSAAAGKFSAAPQLSSRSSSIKYAGIVR